MRWLAMVTMIMVVGAGAQQPLEAKGADPMAVGKAAMDKGDYAAAQKFFADYMRDNPADMEAVFFAGGAELGLQNYAVAADDFKRILAAQPKKWVVRQNLALAYAEMGDWADFDKERAAIKAARDANEPGLSKDKGDLIDVLHVAGKTYEVRYFYTLYGPYKTRYVFLHFGEGGKLADYVQCESDDTDQYFFAQKHAKEAKAGERSFSLDTYKVSDKGMSQGLMKFYSDGEPTYETVRADVLKVLEGQSKPAASMTAPVKK